MKNAKDLIQENIDRHEKIAHVYDKRHTEINNDIEQQRLRTALQQAHDCIDNVERLPVALDFGCGTGNLTRHLVDIGFRVTAADVTPSFVELATAYDPSSTTGFRLNGKDLNGLADDTFDLVATYSVLHHVPDYLAAVRELVRVTRPGGLIVIDHEASPEYWLSSSILDEFRAIVKRPFSLRAFLPKLASPAWYLKKIRLLMNPRYAEEGDIHVWPDDHIEWDEIQRILEETGASIVDIDDYLLYQPHYPLDVYDRYRNRCTDMRLLIARKC